MYRTFWKRPFDLLVTIVCAPIWVPLCGVVALAVAVRLGRPLLFIQRRPGRGAVEFPLLKFRSMRAAASEATALATDVERLTPFGRWLRSTSLDELPSLFNVLAGHLSLVGPRPLLTAYLPRYSPREARRHDVRPGVTGWAQVNGRNRASWPEKLEMDVWYVEHCTFRLDVRILWRTLVTVIRRNDISAPGHDTAPEFMGTPDAATHDVPPSQDEAIR